MAYSKERAANISKNDVKYIPVGINEDVNLRSVRADVAPTGKPFLEIVFEKNGATLYHTEWKPMIGNYVDTEEKLQIKMDKQYSRMLQILHCYYKDEELDFNGETFEEFSKWIASMLDKADKSKKLRVKVVYNKDGFTTLPNYAKYTFIEPMELPEGQTSSISILGIDMLTKPVIADKEEENANPLPNITTTSVNSQSNNSTGDDLPF